MAAEVHSSTPSSSRKAADQVAAPALEGRVGALVVAGRATDLVGQVAEAGVAQAPLVLVVHGGAGLAQEAQEAVAGIAPVHGLELVGQHRRDADGHRSLGALQALQQRQVDAGRGLPQPLLAEGPGVEALDVRHVRVQDERERSRLGAHAGNGEGAGPSRRGTTTHAVSTPRPMTIATTGKLPRLATALKEAWMAMQAKIEPVFS